MALASPASPTHRHLILQVTHVARGASQSKTKKKTPTLNAGVTGEWCDELCHAHDSLMSRCEVCVIIETRMQFSWCNILSVNSPEIHVLRVRKMGAGKNYAHHGVNISNSICGQAFAALLPDAVSTRRPQGRGTHKTPAK